MSVMTMTYYRGNNNGRNIFSDLSVFLKLILNYNNLAGCNNLTFTFFRDEIKFTRNS